MFEDDFSELNKRVEINESMILSVLIDMYIRILEIFDNFGEKIQKMEIKPKVGNLRTDKYSLDYINFLIIIRDKMYSVVLLSKKPTELSQKDLKLYFKIFLKSPRIDGILLIFNDENLNTLFLKSEDLYSGFLDFSNFKQSIQDQFKSFEETLDFLTLEKSYRFPKLKFQDYKITDIINDFEKNLKEVILTEKSKSPSTEKKFLLTELDDFKLTKLVTLFEKYLESDKDRKNEFKDFLDDLG